MLASALKGAVYGRNVKVAVHLQETADMQTFIVLSPVS